MKRPVSETAARVPGMLALLAIALLVGCADTDDERPVTFQYDAIPASPTPASDACAMANQGCPCRTPGEIVDCGKVTVTVDGYESCYDGSRICTEAGVWSDCVADQAVAQMAR